MVLPYDELILRAAILATGIVFGYAIFELMHRVLLPKRRSTVEENEDMWPAEVEDDLERWETASCDEYNIRKFDSRKEFEEHCKRRHRHRHHHKKRREADWDTGNSADRPVR